MPIVEVHGVELYYEEHGSGQPLLLIMGWGGNAAAWKPQVPMLAERFRVIAFDNRGVGRSSAPDEPYSIVQLAADAAGLLDSLQIPSAHVFGISMGGMIAQELALRHPERIEGLVLGCTTPGGPVAAGVEELRQDISSFRETMENGGADMEWFSEFLRRLWTDDAIARADPHLQDFIFALIRFPPTKHGLLRQSEAVAAHDAYDRLDAIGHRTLVVTGEQDELIHPENSKIIASRIAGARLELFPDLKHAFHLERPGIVNASIIEFLEHAQKRSRNGRASVSYRPKAGR